MDKKSNKRRKIQKNKFFKEKTNDVKKRKNYVTSMEINWIENKILEKINKNGYFDTIYKEFEFCIILHY